MRKILSMRIWMKSFLPMRNDSSSGRNLIGTEVVFRFGTGPRTLFVPNNAAFEALEPTDLVSRYFDIESWTKTPLTSILRDHVADEPRLLAADLKDNTTVIADSGTLNDNTRVFLNPPRLKNNGFNVPANIIEADIEAT